MEDTWIKLFRKLKDHDVFDDEAAFRVFMWILLSVDYKNGTMKSGRFWASERLNMNPNTYYAILKRLESNYQLISLTSNNKSTLISVNKWNLYQQQNNNKITTKQQQNNTTQEYKNIISNNNIISDKHGNEFINLILESFNKTYGHEPIDKKPRFEAYNLLRRIKSLLKESGKISDEEIKKGIIGYFTWIKDEETAQNIQHLGTVRRKFNIFKSLVEESKNERQ